MATLAKQSIPDYQKKMLESMSANSGESIATMVRDIFRRESERHSMIYGDEVSEIVNIYKDSEV